MKIGYPRGRSILRRSTIIQIQHLKKDQASHTSSARDDPTMHLTNNLSQECELLSGHCCTLPKSIPYPQPPTPNRVSACPGLASDVASELNLSLELLASTSQTKTCHTSTEENASVRPDRGDSKYSFTSGDVIFSSNMRYVMPPVFSAPNLLKSSRTCHRTQGERNPEIYGS